MTPRKPASKPAKKTAAKRTPAPRRAPAKRKHSGPQAAPAPKRTTTAPLAHEPSKAPNGFIVVDGSNIANSSRKDGKPSLHNIQRVHDILVHEGFEPVIFVDASLRHQIPDSEAKLFAKWEGEAFISQVPRGVNGDEAVLEFASRRDATVLSNDNYQDLEGRYPWVRDRTRRIPYNLVRGELILYRYDQPPPRPPAPLTTGPAQPSEQSQGRGRHRQPRREHAAPSPAPQPAPQRMEPAPPQPPAAPPATTGGQAVPLSEKHRNFRKPRAPPMVQPVQRTGWPTASQPAPRAMEPMQPDEQEEPRQHHGGRGRDIPRATEAEWNELKQRMVDFFERNIPPGESIRADTLSEEIRRSIPNFRPNYYGSSTFTKLLDRMDDVFELARRGPEGQMASLEGPQKWVIVVLRRGPV